MANEFTHKKVTEKEKEEIKKNSKELLEEFSKKLSKIKKEETHFNKENGKREEGSPWKTEPEFKDLTLLNAPFVEDDFLVAEKGGWKK